MTVDLADLPFIHDDGRLPNGAKGRGKCRRHSWITRGAPGQTTFDLGTGETFFGERTECFRCEARRDPAASRRGRSSDRLGKDQERRIERVYGPRKVGEYGDAVDHLGRDFKWQSKATRSLPPKWLDLIGMATHREQVPEYIYRAMGHMSDIGGVRYPLVIRSFVRRGVGTRDWIFVQSHDWLGLHGFGMPAGFIVMPGDIFLELHGRDEEVALHVGETP